LLWKKHLATAPETVPPYGRPERNACRQRLQQLEVDAALAFILARVAAWARTYHSASEIESGITVTP
jgi:hypothetical protein